MEERPQDDERQDMRTAVIEGPEVAAEAVPPALLNAYEEEQAHLTQLHTEFQALTARRSAGQRLTRQEQVDLRAMQDEMADAETRLEPLAKQVALLQARRGITAAKQHHDRYVDAHLNWHEQFANLASLLMQHVQAFHPLVAEQLAPLQDLRRPDGSPAIPTLDSHETLRNIISRMPNPNGWAEVLLGLTARPLTKADLDQMTDVDPGTRPVPEGVVRRFLEGR